MASEERPKNFNEVTFLPTVNCRYLEFEDAAAVYTPLTEDLEEITVKTAKECADNKLASDPKRNSDSYYLKLKLQKLGLPEDALKSNNKRKISTECLRPKSVSAVKLVAGKYLFKCSNCQRIYQREHDYWRHIEICQVRNDESTDCRISQNCNRWKQTKYGKVHIPKAKKTQAEPHSTILQYNEENPAPKVLKNQCPVCQYFFSSKNFNRHVKRCKNREILRMDNPPYTRPTKLGRQCPICQCLHVHCNFEKHLRRCKRLRREGLRIAYDNATNITPILPVCNKESTECPTNTARETIDTTEEIILENENCSAYIEEDDRVWLVAHNETSDFKTEIKLEQHCVESIPTVSPLLSNFNSFEEEEAKIDLSLLISTDKEKDVVQHNIKSQDIFYNNIVDEPNFQENERRPHRNPQESFLKLLSCKDCCKKFREIEFLEEHIRIEHSIPEISKGTYDFDDDDSAEEEMEGGIEAANYFYSSHKLCPACNGVFKRQGYKRHKIFCKINLRSIKKRK